MWLCIVNLFCMYILYKCYPNKTVFFIAFFRNGFTTRSTQGWNNNLISTKSQRHWKVQIQPYIFQPYFNVDVWLLFQRWYSVVMPSGNCYIHQTAIPDWSTFEFKSCITYMIHAWFEVCIYMYDEIWKKYERMCMNIWTFTSVPPQSYTLLWYYPYKSTM